MQRRTKRTVKVGRDHCGNESKTILACTILGKLGFQVSLVFEMDVTECTPYITVYMPAFVCMSVSYYL